MASLGENIRRLLKKMAKQQDQHGNADGDCQLDGTNEAHLKQLSEGAAQAIDVADSEFLDEPAMPTRGKAFLQGNFAVSSSSREKRKSGAVDPANIIYDSEESTNQGESLRVVSFNKVISYRRLDEMEELHTASHADLESPLDEPSSASKFADRLIGADKADSADDWAASPLEALAPGKTASPTEESFKQVAACPTTSPSTLGWLASQPSAEIRAAVASNQHVPQDTLRKLACDADGNVRLAVARNKKTADDILRSLTHDDNRLVCGEANSALILREKAASQASSAGFNQFAPPKVNPMQTKVPIIGGGTTSKPALLQPSPPKPALPAPSFSKTQSLPSPIAGAIMAAKQTQPAPSQSTPAPDPSLPPSDPPAPSLSSALSNPPAPSLSSAPSNPPAPSPLDPSVPDPASETLSAPSPASETSSPSAPPPAPSPAVDQAALIASQAETQAPVARFTAEYGSNTSKPSMPPPSPIAPRSLPKPTLASSPLTTMSSIPASPAAKAREKSAPLEKASPLPQPQSPPRVVTPPAPTAPAPAPAASVRPGQQKAAQAPVSAPAPAVAQAAPPPPPAETPKVAAFEKPAAIEVTPLAGPDGHDLLANHKFKMTSNHLVASYTDLDAISVEIETRSPNAWLSLNSENAIKAYKKQKDTVKDVNLNLAAHNPQGPKRNSPVVNIGPNATASETVAFLKLVAARVSTPPGRLIELAEHTNEEVRAAVAENTNLPEEAFNKLAKDTVSTVKLRLIDNSACPTEILATLQNDGDPYVAFEARNALKRISRSLLKEREHHQKGHGHSSPGAPA